MPEAEIRPELPLGSPILAYGTSSPWKGRRMFLAIAAGIFVLLAGAIIWLCTAKIRMPERVLAIAAVRKETRLPDGFPLVWKNAARGNGSSLLGLVLTEHGIEPFAMTGSKLIVTSDQPITTWKTVSLTELLALRWKTIFSPSYLRVDPSMIGMKGQDVIEGPIDANGNWNTKTKIAKRESQELPNGNLALDVSTFPEAWPIIIHALHERGFPFETDVTPSAIGWTSSSGTVPRIDLTFDRDVSSSTILSFASAAGLSDVASYRLPDGTVVSELRLPEKRLTSTSSDALQTGDGASLKISPNRLSIVSDTQMPEMTRSCAEGRSILRLSAEMIDSIVFSAKIPFLHPFQSIEAVELNGKLRVCIK